MGGFINLLNNWGQMWSYVKQLTIKNTGDNTIMHPFILNSILKILFLFVDEQESQQEPGKVKSSSLLFKKN